MDGDSEGRREGFVLGRDVGLDENLGWLLGLAVIVKVGHSDSGKDGIMLGIRVGDVVGAIDGVRVGPDDVVGLIVG